MPFGLYPRVFWEFLLFQAVDSRTIAVIQPVSQPDALPCPDLAVSWVGCQDSAVSFNLASVNPANWTGSSEFIRRFVNPKKWLAIAGNTLFF